MKYGRKVNCRHFLRGGGRGKLSYQYVPSRKCTKTFGKDDTTVITYIFHRLLILLKPKIWGPDGRTTALSHHDFVMPIESHCNHRKYILKVSLLAFSQRH